MKRLGYIIIGVVGALLCMSCSHKAPRHVIGVSQCSEDIWRHKQNAELIMGTYAHENVELKFAAAYDSDARQVQQIDSLLDAGIDLLIVAPNQVATITPAIDRAYDRGIPVIVFDRKTSSNKYTAYIGADNHEMGRMMGDYIASQLKEHGRVLEIMGLRGSSPAIERHEGFVEALSHYPDIHLVASLQGDWTEESAVEAINKYDGVLSDIDFVFGQNDRMAVGARKALAARNGQHASASVPQFCGIDGLPGKGGGIECVVDGTLAASCIYPTRGDEVLQLAIDILEGRPYDKEIMLNTALVTPDNAWVLQMQNDELVRQTQQVNQLHLMADNYLQQLSTQRTINWLAGGIILLLLLLIMLFYLYHLKKISIQRERVVNNLWNLEPATEEPAAADDASSLPQPSSEEPAQQHATQQDEPAEDATVDSVTSSLFISRFKEAVEARLADSDLSIEELAADMSLSRVQLYRKVKNITGSSPVELLRTARLNRGYQLLLTTDKTISEVAYAVGFTAPSYFTKCFKDEFGMLPGDVRTQ